MKSIAKVVALIVLVAAPSLMAQWPRHMTAAVPKTPDGKVDLDAPGPRTADGKPDLSGVWGVVPCIDCPAGRAGGPGRGAAAPAETTPPAQGAVPGAAAGRGRGGQAGPPRATMGNIGGGLPEGAPYQPWAADLVKKRMADNSKDNPDAHCLPLGIAQMNAHPYPRKIIQTPTEVVLIYEGSGTTVREVYLDGRTLPTDPEPWYIGYSVGRWEGTIDDPKVYTRPFTAKLYWRLSPDTQLIEFVCIDKDAPHYVGATPAAATPAK